jgi:uncharacterized protein YfeS
MRVRISKTAIHNGVPTAYVVKVRGKKFPRGLREWYFPEDKKAEAFNFLRSIGEADIIKNEVVVSFGMGQDNVAGAVVDDLRNQGLAPAQKTHIHPMTLRTWAKNRIENNQEIDFDTFGIYVGNRAKIKGAK